MKTRQFFVSNSSTSSYVVLGYLVNEEDYEDEEFERLQDEGEIMNTELGSIRGDTIMRWSDEGYEMEQYSLAEVLKKAQALCDKTGVKLEEIKLFCGLDCC